MSDVVNILRTIIEQSDLKQSTTAKALIKFKEDLIPENMKLMSLAKKLRDGHINKTKVKQISNSIISIKQQIIIYISVWSINIQQGIVSISDVRVSLRPTLRLEQKLISRLLNKYCNDRQSLMHEDARVCNKFLTNVLK